MTAAARRTGPLYETDDTVPALPPGFSLDPHPAAANDAPPLPAGYTPDAPQPQSGDDSEMVPADTLPPQAKSRMSPEDEAHVTELLRAKDYGKAVEYAAHRGFDLSNVAAIQRSQDAGNTAPAGAVYELPKIADEGAVDSAARGVADTLTFGTFPKIGALIDGAAAAIHGDGFTDAFTHSLDRRNAEEIGSEDNHPWARVAGQLLGGLALPSGLEGVGLKAGTDVLKAGGSMTEARVAAKIAVRNRMATVGGGYGAGHGAGSADTPADALTGALVEGGLGAATGGLFGQAGRSAKPDVVASTAASQGQQVMQAAARQGIDPLPADVGGGFTRRATGAAAQMPFSAAMIAEAGQRVTDQAQAARDRVAASVGAALAPEQAGQSALSGAQSYMVSSRTANNALYRAAETAAGDTRVAPTKAIAALDGHIAELAETPGGAPGLTTLQGLRDSLAQGDVSVGGLRRMRTVLRDQFIKDGLRGTDIERRVNGVLDAAREDIQEGLSAAGKGNAAGLFAKADAAHALRARTIDTVLKPLIGTRDAPKSGEAIAKALMGDLQGNNARAVAFLRTLPPEEQANTRASIIGQMGRVSPGAQNPDGDAFSLPAFLTSWDKIGETAKRAYFGDEGRAALNDLAIVANGAKLAQRYANHSNTTGGLEWGRLLTTITALPTLGGSIAGQFALGKLLASPRFARWLARAPKSSLSPVAYADRLSRIARAEPAIANEVLALQQRLNEAFSTVPTRIAADERGDHGAGADRNAAQQNAQTNELQP